MLSIVQKKWKPCNLSDSIKISRIKLPNSIFTKYIQIHTIELTNRLNLQKKYAKIATSKRHNLLYRLQIFCNIVSSLFLNYC